MVALGVVLERDPKVSNKKRLIINLTILLL